jgi:hypothetical protein
LFNLIANNALKLNFVHFSHNYAFLDTLAFLATLATLGFFSTTGATISGLRQDLQDSV